MFQFVPCWQRAVFAITTLLIASLAASPRALAEEKSAPFYRGRTVTIVVGFSGGGGYDLYARLAARFLGRHLAGQPTVVVQNLTGAGGLRAAKHVHTVAPKDGTVLLLPAQTIAYDTLLGLTGDVDAGAFQWLARLAMNIDVGVASGSLHIAGASDLRARHLSVGGTGGTASSTLVPYLLNALAGTHLKLVSGYHSAQEGILAMRRGELDMVGATGLSTMLSVHASEMRSGSLAIVYQTGRERASLIPAAPTLIDLALGEEESAVLALYSASSDIGRSLAVGPGVPLERVDELRLALADMLADPELRAVAERQSLSIEPADGETITRIVRETLKAPAAVAGRARSVMSGMKQ